MVHLLDFLGLIFLTMIWAICPRDSLALLGQWIQSKLQEVSLRQKLEFAIACGEDILILL